MPAIKMSLSKTLSLLNSALWCPGLDSAHHTSAPLAGYLLSSALREHRRESVRLEEEGGMSDFTFVSHWLPFFLLLRGLPQNASSPWQKPCLSAGSFPNTYGASFVTPLPPSPTKIPVPTDILQGLRVNCTRLSPQFLSLNDFHLLLVFSPEVVAIFIYLSALLFLVILFLPFLLPG